jgi:hypothetical protein
VCSVTPPPPPHRLIDFGWVRTIKELGTCEAEAGHASASEHSPPSEEEEEEQGTPPSEEEEPSKIHRGGA